ncbi:MAG: hypothetical protein ABI430_02485 [Candidatus Taylorbacteria bacterium]
MLKTYQIDETDIPLLEYNNIFVGNLTWIKRGIVNDTATYDLVVRELASPWSFYVMNGLERFIDILTHYRFDEEGIRIMKEIGLIDSPEVEKYYRNFKFTGSVFAMLDGTIFFPGEPIIRITAPLGEANILTAFMMNVLSYPVRLLTKMTRVKMATGNDKYMSGTVVRLPGFEQGLWNIREAYILGSPQYTPLFYKKFPQYKPSGKIGANINHAFIKSFGSEREAFRYFFDNILKKCDSVFVMIDTYEIENGLKIFIEEARKVTDFGMAKLMITIDSGDIEKRARWARNKLDKAGLKKIGIQVMSNLDEYIVDKMVKRKTPIDLYFCGTAVGNVIDSPKLEAVYKMAELTHQNGEIELKAKLTKGKESYPGRKQVFRTYKQGKMAGDIIGLENENLGEALLKEVVSKGKALIKIDNLDEIKVRLESELRKLPDAFKNLHIQKKYKVTASKELLKLVDVVKQIHLNK